MEERCDSISIVKNEIETLEQNSDVIYWLIICIVALLVIVAIMFIWITRQKNFAKMNSNKAETEQPDMSILLNGMFKAQPLYDKLKKVVHPDRFAGDVEKVDIANDIFQRISQNRTKYEVLLELQKEAEEKLNIKIT